MCVNGNLSHRPSLTYLSEPVGGFPFHTWDVILSIDSQMVEHNSWPRLTHSSASQTMPWTFRRRGVWAIARVASRAGKGEGKNEGIVTKYTLKQRIN